MLIAAGYYGVAQRIDWWLYHFFSGRQQRDIAIVEQRIMRSGLPFQSLGRVVYDGVQWPLDAVILKKPVARRQACIFAGVHGNEPAGTEAALTLIDDLARDSLLYPSWNFVIVPVANPWGWAHDLRHNGDNLDIARQFHRADTGETALIKKLLAREHCDLLVDLHEDRLESGLYMLTYENPRLERIRAITREIEATGVPLKSSAPGGIHHVREAEFDTVRSTTLSLYARQHGTAQSHIVETPARLPMPTRVRLHRQVLARLLATLDP